MNCGGPDEAEENRYDGGGIWDRRKCEKAGMAEEELKSNDNDDAKGGKYEEKRPR